MNEVERALSTTAPEVEQAAAEAARRVARRADADGMLDVAYAWADSPFGPLLVAATPRGVVRLAYEYERPEAVLDELALAVSPRVLEAPFRLDRVRAELDEYFSGRRHRFEVPVDWSLTDGFVRRVLRATARIPYGRMATYRDMAARAGSPRAARAAGNALGANPIPIVVPCHRVIRSGGALGGYGGGGPARKAFLLRLEGALSG